jgi:putative membrane protein
MESTLNEIKEKQGAAAVGELRQRRVARDYLGLVARGFCMGAADVVPGVSGGTMAFILGIYEELIQSIRMVGQPEFLRNVFRLRWREVLRLLNWPFLMAVATGIFLAIISLASGLTWLLENQPTMVWSFFFGLVLASVFVVSKRIPRWTPPLMATMAAATIAAYLLVGLAPAQTPEAGWFLFLSGALVITAMILPGISGAFILVLLGKYQFMLNAVNQRDIVTLAIVSLGAAVGLVTFAQVLSWLFKRYHDLTVALLTGLMLGSLRRVWPWKIDLAWTIDRHGQQAPTLQQNILPELWLGGSLNPDVIIAIALGVAGCTAVLLLDRWANHQSAAAYPAR